MQSAEQQRASQRVPSGTRRRHLRDRWTTSRVCTFDRSDLDVMNSNTPTPSGSTRQIMDAINGVRTGGKPVVRTRRTTRKRMTFYEFDYPFAEGDFPGGPGTVCLALLVRMHQQLGTPVPDDEGGDATSLRVDPSAIDRLAASIEILEPSEPGHGPHASSGKRTRRNTGTGTRRVVGDLAPSGGMPFVRAECGATTERHAARHDADDDDQLHRGDAHPAVPRQRRAPSRQPSTGWPRPSSSSSRPKRCN